MSGKIQNLLNLAETSTDGKSSVSFAEREFSSAAEAGEIFAALRPKLYDVNRWEIESGVSSFQLFDENGRGINAAKAGVGNFIRITLPGSGKHDWVKIKNIDDDENELVITVSPSFDPTEKETDESRTSHFFTSDSVNNFCLGKKGEARLGCYVIGLGEKPNTAEADGILEAVRNAATAAAGWLGLQKIEWQTFCENFLNSKIAAEHAEKEK